MRSPVRCTPGPRSAGYSPPDGGPLRGGQDDQGSQAGHGQERAGQLDRAGQAQVRGQQADRGRDAELAADAGAQQAYQEGVARGQLTPLPVWASEAVGLINELTPAASLVGVLAAQAEEALARAAGRRGRR
jgi:hypothetical protein